MHLPLFYNRRLFFERTPLLYFPLGKFAQLGLKGAIRIWNSAKSFPVLLRALLFIDERMRKKKRFISKNNRIPCGRCSKDTLALQHI